MPALLLNRKGFTLIRRPIKSNHGFTLIELLVVVAILLVISAIALSSLSLLQKQVDLDSTGQSIISILRLARSKTLASESQTQYGVHFDTGQYVLFSGSSYTFGDPGNKIYPLTSATISNINLNGGGNEVIFDRIRGTTSENGSISLQLVSDSSRTITILIDSQGQVSASSAVTTSGTRIAGSRHLHFDLSNTGDCNSGARTIYNATTLKLEWVVAPTNVVQNIPMAGFFNSGKTAFDWSGTVNVNGSNQTLRIHTHCLSAFNTILSINRDQRYNNVPLNVYIDSNLVVSYLSGSCTPNLANCVSVSAWGGFMSVQ